MSFVRFSRKDLFRLRFPVSRPSVYYSFRLRVVRKSFNSKYLPTKTVEVAFEYKPIGRLRFGQD